MFLELGAKTHRGKERFPFFCIARCLFSNWYMSQIKQEVVDLHIQINFLAIRQQKFIWSLKEELSGVRPKAVVISK